MRSNAHRPDASGLSSGNHSPTVWILSQGRRGDLSQMQTLVEALGWPSTVKTLAFRPPAIPALAPFLLKTGASDPLDSPWPDLIICAEALCSIVALWLRRKSRGHSKIVCVGRPAGRSDPFDLVITTAQYRLPSAANIVELALPLSQPREYSADASSDAIAPGPRPHLAVLVGASSSPDKLDRTTARNLAQDLCRYAAAQGGTLTLVTSPRTGTDVANALAGPMRPPHHVHIYGQAPEDSYRRIIADANEIIVTSDSVSMVVDALEARKPVLVYALPQSRSWQFSFAEWAQRQVLKAGKRPLMLRPLAWLFHLGFVEVSADRRQLFDRLAAEGRLQWFGREPPLHAPHPESPFKKDLDNAVTRVKALFPKLV